MSSSESIPFNSDSNVNFYSTTPAVEEGDTSSSQTPVEESEVGKNKRVMSTWVTVGVVVVMCVLGSAAYMSSGSSSTTTQTKVTQVQAKKATPASSVPVVPEKKDAAEEWQTVSPEDAKVS